MGLMYRWLQGGVRLIDRRVLPHVRADGTVGRLSMFTRNYLNNVSWFWQDAPPREDEKHLPDITLKRIVTSFVGGCRMYVQTWSREHNEQWEKDDKARLRQDVASDLEEAKDLLRETGETGEAAGRHVLRSFAKDRIQLYKEGLGEFMTSFKRARAGQREAWEPLQNTRGGTRTRSRGTHRAKNKNAHATKAKAALSGSDEKQHTDG